MPQHTDMRVYTNDDTCTVAPLKHCKPFFATNNLELVYIFFGVPITGVHSNQDQIWLVHIGEYIVFYVDLRS